MPKKTPKTAGNEPSPLQVEEVVREFAFTCDKCDMRGDRTREPDVTELKSAFGGPSLWVWNEKKSDFLIDKYPDRCKDCERNKKRYQRMKRAIQKLYDISFTKYKTYGYPKMLTIALPSKWNDSRTRDEQVRELKTRWRILRKELLNYQLEGGVFSVECTQKVRFDNDLYGEEKYHAHIHAVVILPWIPRNRLKDFCALGLKLGLGRMNIKGKGDGDYERPADYKSHLASYLAKYITKDGVNGRASRWGCMMKKQLHH